MTERKPLPDTIVQQVFHEIPQGWYESDTVVGFYARALVVALAAMKTYEYFTDDSSLYAKITAVCLFAMSAVADNYSTIRGFRASDALQEHGVDVEAREINLIIGPVKTQKEFLRNPRTWAVDVLGLSVAIINPSIGVGVAFAKGYATVGNMKGARREERVLEIVEERQNQITPYQVSGDSRG